MMLIASPPELKGNTMKLTIKILATLAATEALYSYAGPRTAIRGGLGMEAH